LGSLTSKEIAEDKKTTIKIGSGFILLILGIAMAISGAQMFGIAITGAGGSFSLVIPVVLTLLVFGAVLAMLYAQTSLNKQDSEAGGMRKTIAGLLVVGLIAVVLFALGGRIQPDSKDIITQYVQLVGIVIAFYFGSKATSDAYKGASEDEGDAEKDLDIENAAYDCSTGIFSIDLINKNSKNFTFNGISIKDKDNKVLFSQTFPSGLPISASGKNPMSVAVADAKKKNELKDIFKANKEKKYTITIDTSMKPKSSKSVDEEITSSNCT